MQSAKQHQLSKHLADPNAKEFECLIQSCAKTFAAEHLMYNHMNKDHKITKKMLANLEQNEDKSGEPPKKMAKSAGRSTYKLEVKSEK